MFLIRVPYSGSLFRFLNQVPYLDSFFQFPYLGSLFENLTWVIYSSLFSGIFILVPYSGLLLGLLI